MKKKQRSQFPKTAVIAVVALVLVGGSFAMASGAIAGPGSLMASVIVALTGRPTVIIGKDGASPAGSIKMGVANQTLATFDIKANNVTNWATIKATNLQVVISSSIASPISVSNLVASYNYCIPAGVTYGYGWKGGSCGTISLGTAQPSATTNQGTTVVNFYNQIPVYPENSYGTISIVGTPNYQYTGTKTLSGSGDGSLQVKVSSLTASGDQCKTTPTYGYTDGHKWGIIGSAQTGCVSYNAVVNIQAGSGNVLKVARSVGYGYLAGDIPPTTRLPVTFTASPATISVGGNSVLTWNAANASMCLLYYLNNGSSVLMKDSGPASGTYSVTPTKTTTYEAYCKNSSTAGLAYATVNVASTPLPPPPVPLPPTPIPPPAPVSCTLSGTVVSSSGAVSSAKLSWTTTNATSAVINNGVGSVTPVAAGSKTVTLGTTPTYTMTATGTGGTASCSASIVR